MFVARLVKSSLRSYTEHEKLLCKYLRIFFNVLFY